MHPHSGRKAKSGNERVFVWGAVILADWKCLLPDVVKAADRVKDEMGQLGRQTAVGISNSRDADAVGFVISLRFGDCSGFGSGIFCLFIFAAVHHLSADAGY